ncbi:MAG TPA: NfeD family protein, partial [Propionibacteriaceae bacterium]|nr:NfeD family protein [Propionibacteriaceae bacterium]
GGAIGSTAAWSVLWLTRRLRSGEDSATFRSDSMIGHTARVITPIPTDGYGEIHVTVAGHVRKVSARSSHPVAAGTEVWVSAVVSPTAVEVTPTDDPPELTD